MPTNTTTTGTNNAVGTIQIYDKPAPIPSGSNLGRASVLNRLKTADSPGGCLILISQDCQPPANGSRATQRAGNLQTGILRAGRLGQISVFE